MLLERGHEAGLARHRQTKLSLGALWRLGHWVLSGLSHTHNLVNNFRLLKKLVKNKTYEFEISSLDMVHDQLQLVFTIDYTLLQHLKCLTYKF